MEWLNLLFTWSFWQNFLNLSYNFYYDFILVFMQKKVYLHGFIFLLEHVQYLSKMPLIGRFSTTHQITRELKVHITPFFSVAFCSILKRWALNSRKSFWQNFLFFDRILELTLRAAVKFKIMLIHYLNNAWS